MHWLSDSIDTFLDAARPGTEGVQAQENKHGEFSLRHLN
jgi:hypothetical protein